MCFKALPFNLSSININWYLIQKKWFHVFWLKITGFLILIYTPNVQSMQCPKFMQCVCTHLPPHLCQGKFSHIRDKGRYGGREPGGSNDQQINRPKWGAQPPDSPPANQALTTHWTCSSWDEGLGSQSKSNHTVPWFYKLSGKAGMDKNQEQPVQVVFQSKERFSRNIVINRLVQWFYYGFLFWL